MPVQGKARTKAYKGGGGVGVLQAAGAHHLLQGDLRLHTCDSLGVLVDVAVASRDGEDVLGSLPNTPQQISVGTTSGCIPVSCGCCMMNREGQSAILPFLQSGAATSNAWQMKMQCQLQKLLASQAIIMSTLRSKG